jgi:hypothetical protein
MLRLIVTVNVVHSSTDSYHCEEILYIAFLRKVLRLLVTANIVHSSPILVALMIDAIHSSETSVLIRVTRYNIQDDFLHRHRHETLKSYTALTGWSL